MSKKTKTKSIAARLPLLHVYSTVFLVMELVGVLTYIRHWSEHVERYISLGLTRMVSNGLAVGMVCLVILVFTLPLINMVTSTSVKSVRRSLHILLGIFLLGLVVVLARGSIYSMAVIAIEVGFTLYMLRLTNELD